MKKLIIFSFFIFLTISETYSQDKDKISIETIKIKTDRDKYVSGEDIWFQIFINNSQSSLSYIELINPAGFSIARKKILTKEGIGFSYLHIPDTVSTSNYTIIGYTNSSNKKSCLGKANVIIYNPEKNKLINCNKSINYSLENNNIVAELKTRIYFFNSINNISIINTNNNDIDYTVNKLYNYVEFIPKKNENYLIYNKKCDIKIPLPETKNEGIVTHLNNINLNEVIFSIQSSTNYITDYQKLFICDNNNKIIETVELDNKVQAFNLSLKDKKWNEIIIKTASGEILWHRKLYSTANISNNIELLGVESKYSTRNKYNFQITNKAHDSDLDLCLSIYKISNSTQEVENKVNYLLKENYELLFQNSIKNTNKLMSEEQGILLKGEILKENKHKLKNTTIYICPVDSVCNIHVTTTNNKGEFQYLISPDSKNKDIVLKANISDNNLYYKIHDKFLNSYTNFELLTDIQLSKTDSSLLNKYYINKRINMIYNINNKEKYNIELNKNDWSINSFYDDPDIFIDFDNYIKLDSIQEYFYELVPSVKIIRNSGKLVFSMFDKNKRRMPGQPAVFIDGILYDDATYFLSIDPKLCKKIEIIKSRFLIYDKIYSGIISLFTKEYSDLVIPSNSTRINYQLFNDLVLFNFNEKKSNIPDFRNTLIWKPNINIEKNENCIIDFYTSNDKGTYSLDIFGYDSDGKRITIKKQFIVK